MKRYFYINNDLDELETLVKDLESQKIDQGHVRILSNDDAELEKHHLNQVESLFKKDVIRCSMRGFVVGVIVAALILGLTYAFSLVSDYLWIPVIFLAVIALGFCTWEGGLIGIQEPHHEYKKFQKLLEHGKHVLIVDIKPSQEARLTTTVKSYPRVKFAGVIDKSSSLVAGTQTWWNKFIHWAP